MIIVRVYGILINEFNQILVSDELIKGSYFTKFCGGGLEEGEGTRDCLKREFMEEMGIEIEVKDHFYTTDFFQPNFFRKTDQILSIYYLVKALDKIEVKENKIAFDFNEAQQEKYKLTGQTETFRFIGLDKYSEEDMSLPIDKIVANMVKEKYC